MNPTLKNYLIELGTIDYLILNKYAIGAIESHMRLNHDLIHAYFESKDGLIRTEIGSAIERSRNGE